MEWRVEPGLLPYPKAVAAMRARADAVRAGSAEELIWLVEHPPLYTAGTSAAPAELLEPVRLPVFASGRGGRYTYHGPGQRIVYIIADLDRRGRDLRAYVAGLEAWIVAALDRLGLAAFTAPGRIGVWVATPQGEAKIGAIGIRVQRWVSLHGMSINVAPDLAAFDGIVPCGLAGFAVTSLRALGIDADMRAVDAALAATLPALLQVRDTPATHVAIALEGIAESANVHSG